MAPETRPSLGGDSSDGGGMSEEVQPMLDPNGSEPATASVRNISIIFARKYAAATFLAAGLVAASLLFDFRGIHQTEKLEYKRQEFLYIDDSFQFSTSNTSNAPPNVDFRSAVSPVPNKYWPDLDNFQCLPQGKPDYPPEDIAARRIPYAILLGGMKCGTTALSDYLYQHPQIVHPHGVKEVHFYDQVYDDEIATRKGIPRADTRAMYRDTFRDALKERYAQVMANASLLALDDSPRYLLWSDRVPARLLCVTPWAKVFAILRNPVDRVYSHYTMLSTSPRNRHARKMSFEQWLDRDLASLRKLGVIQNWTSQEEFDAFAGSEAEMEAWKRYTRTGTQAALGRGLYALQLRHWFRAYEDAGRKRSDILLIRSEEMKEHTEEVFQRVLKFLELPIVPLEDKSAKYSGRYHGRKMSNETRATLEAFFAPYNRHLYDLLGADWEGVWDPSDQNDDRTR